MTALFNSNSVALWVPGFLAALDAGCDRLIPWALSGAFTGPGQSGALRRVGGPGV